MPKDLTADDLNLAAPLEIEDMPVNDEKPILPQESGDSPDSVDSTPLKKLFFASEAIVSQKEQELLDIVWKHFAERSSGPGETLGRIRDLERSLALPSPGESRIQHIAAFVKLLQHESDIQNEKRAYY